MARFSSFRLGVVAVILAAGAVAGAYLSDCTKGMGAGTGSGTPLPTPADAESPPSKSASETVTVRIEVVGDQCHVDEDEAGACDKACGAVGGDKDRPVIVDGTMGAHKTVDELRRCLHTAGFTQVRVLSE